MHQLNIKKTRGCLHYNDKALLLRLRDVLGLDRPWEQNGMTSHHLIGAIANIFIK